MSRSYHHDQVNNCGFNGMMYSNDSVGMASATNDTNWSQNQQQLQLQFQNNNSDKRNLTHPEWGVIKKQDFHPLTLKHQVDLENSYQSGKLIPDFYFWQASLNGYCMADMVNNVVIASEGVYVLVRRIVDGAPRPGRRKKKVSTNEQ